MPDQQGQLCLEHDPRLSWWRRVLGQRPTVVHCFCDEGTWPIATRVQAARHHVTGNSALHYFGADVRAGLEALADAIDKELNQ